MPTGPLLDSNIKLDISNLTLPDQAEIKITKRSDFSFSNSNISLKIYDTSDVEITNPESLPFTPNIITVDYNTYNIILVFDKPIQNIGFGFNRKLVLTNNSLEEMPFRLEVNYVPQFLPSHWTNSSETEMSITNITFKERIQSLNLNNKLRTLFNGILSAINKCNVLIDKYYFRQNLPDIIDFALEGALLENSVTTLTDDADSITKETTYTTAFRRTKVNVVYNYTTDALICLNDDDTTRESVSIKSLNNIVINAKDSTNIIYTLGIITINRTTQTILVPEALANFKKFRFKVMTGWTVGVQV